MRHYFAMLLIVLAVVTAIPMVRAESNSTDNETIHEIEEMDNAAGAQMRLLQLERELERKVIQGNAIIAAIKARDSTANTTELQNLLTQIKTLITRVQAAEKNVTNQSNQEAIDAFIAIKREGKDIVAKFRARAKDMINAQDRVTIKQKLEDADRTALKDIGERIESQRKEHRAERLERVLAISAITDEAFVDRVRNGEVNNDDVRTYLREQVGKLPGKERSRIIQALRDQQEKRHDESRSRLKLVQEARFEDRNSRDDDQLVSLEAGEGRGRDREENDGRESDDEREGDGEDDDREEDDDDGGSWTNTPLVVTPPTTTTPPSTTTTVTGTELASHNTRSDCWVGYDGRAYDVTAFLPRHPGGVSAISRYCGTSTAFANAFEGQHGTGYVSRLIRESTLKGTLA